MKKRPGRPPVDPEKRLGNPVEVRFTDAQKDLIDSVLPPDGSVTRAEFIRAAAVKEAERLRKRKP